MSFHNVFDKSLAAAAGHFHRLCLKPFLHWSAIFSASATIIIIMIVSAHKIIMGGLWSRL
jgi:hypothetical protein